MKIITKEIARKLPPLYSQENAADPQVVLKLFTPWTSWTWYVTEGQKEGEGEYDWLLFGFCLNMADPDSAELGYVSLAELMEVQGPAGLRVERDMWFKPRPLSECKENHP